MTPDDFDRAKDAAKEIDLGIRVECPTCHEFFYRSSDHIQFSRCEDNAGMLRALVWSMQQGRMLPDTDTYRPLKLALSVAIAEAEKVERPALRMVKGSEGWTLIETLVVALIVGILLAIGLGLLIDDTPDGEHRWRGGSGPETRCTYEYEDETRTVNKVAVTEQVVYTVCRDAR